MHLPVLSTAAALASIPLAAARTATVIDATQTFGTWEGWGVSLAWWAKAFGDREDLADIFFTDKPARWRDGQLPGLGLNIVRYNAGASSYDSCDGEGMVMSPNIKPSRQMDGYWVDWASADPASSSWTWTVDANQRAMLQRAKAKGATIFELFSNSPMWWMCRNHDPSGNRKGGRDNLQPWNYDKHAVYLATIDQHARASWGIDFQSVEAFNEPATSFWSATGTQEGCHFDVGTMDEVTAHMREELAARNSPALIAASDENTYDDAVRTWESMAQQTVDAIGRINVHGYQGRGGRRDRLYAHARAAGKRLWNSEYGDSDASGRGLAQNLLLDFAWLHPTAWVYWQSVDGGGWGLIDGDNDDVTLGAATTKYFVLAQFARHIRPGMAILGAAGEAADTVAAYDAENRLLVVVAANWDEDRHITFRLAGFGVPGTEGQTVKRWRTMFDGSELYEEKEDTTLHGDRFWSWFASGTVQTFEITGVEM